MPWPSEMWLRILPSPVPAQTMFGSEGATASESEMLGWCVEKIAGYKRPRSVAFIADEDMPRTATGKILHRVLKERL